jgi:hypothetical protein
MTDDIAQALPKYDPIAIQTRPQSATRLPTSDPRPPTSPPRPWIRY